MEIGGVGVGELELELELESWSWSWRVGVGELELERRELVRGGGFISRRGAMRRRSLASKGRFGDSRTRRVRKHPRERRGPREDLRSGATPQLLNQPLCSLCTLWLSTSAFSASLREKHIRPNRHRDLPRRSRVVALTGSGCSPHGVNDLPSRGVWVSLTRGLEFPHGARGDIQGKARVRSAH